MECSNECVADTVRSIWYRFEEPNGCVNECEWLRTCGYNVAETEESMMMSE